MFPYLTDIFLILIACLMVIKGMNRMLSRARQVWATPALISRHPRMRPPRGSRDLCMIRE
jgi:hypothetical protein